jgi:hypothetical protein
MMNKYLIMPILLLLVCITIPISKIPITLTNQRPGSIDNSSNIHFRSIIMQLGNSCGVASGVSYVFNYEINAARNQASNIDSALYPYIYTYHFLNDGNGDVGEHFMYLNAWQLIKDNGIPDNITFGGYSSGYPTKWMSGYQRYLKGMGNRIKEYDSIATTNSSSLDTIRQWLADHGNGSRTGGLFSLSAGIMGGAQSKLIVSGPETGKYIVTRFGSDTKYLHAFTIVGYNDSIGFDINSDGKITNNIDITNDGKVDLADWEKGGFKIANTYGPTDGDKGFMICQYRLLALPFQSGGIKSNHVYFCSAFDQYTVRLAFKISLTHTTRNALSFSVGVSDNADDVTPDKIKSYQNLFNYAGGAFPMCGESMSETIETGIDISDLLDSIQPSSAQKVFLIVNSKGGRGKINTVTLMNYTTGKLDSVISTQSNISIPSGTTIVGIVKNITNATREHKKHLKSKLSLKYSGNTLRIAVPFTGEYELTINDLKGRLIYTNKTGISTGTDLAFEYKFSSGQYILRIRNSPTGWEQRSNFTVQ